MVKRITNNFGIESVKIAAYTGSAAINVDGNMIHSLFKIPINHKTFTTLEGKAAQNF